MTSLNTRATESDATLNEDHNALSRTLSANVDRSAGELSKTEVVNSDGGCGCDMRQRIGTVVTATL